MATLALNDAVVKEVNIVADVIAKGSCRPCLELKNDRVTLFILTTAIDLRAKEHFANHHVAEVVFISELVNHFLGEFNSWFVRFQVQNEVIIEEVGVCSEHLLHILAHLE